MQRNKQKEKKSIISLLFFSERPIITFFSLNIFPYYVEIPGFIISLHCMFCVCVCMYSACVSPCTFFAFAFWAEGKKNTEEVLQRSLYKCLIQSHSEIKAYRWPRGLPSIFFSICSLPNFKAVFFFFPFSTTQPHPHDGPQAKKKRFFWFWGKRRTSKIHIPAGVIIRRWVLIVLREAVEVTRVDCWCDLVENQLQRPNKQATKRYSSMRLTMSENKC